MLAAAERAFTLICQRADAIRKDDIAMRVKRVNAQRQRRRDYMRASAMRRAARRDDAPRARE